MQYKTVKGFTGFAQLGILLVFLGLGFILAGGVQLIICLQIIPAGIPLKKMNELMLKALLDPQNVSYARLAQVLGSFFSLFVPAVLYSWIVNGRNKFWLGFNRYINIYQVLIGFAIIFFANVLAAPLEDLSKAAMAHLPSLDTVARDLEKMYNDNVAALSNLKSWPEFIMAIFIMAFFPALFEEVFFRGAVQNLLVRWWKAPLLAIIATSLFFSLFHMSVYLFLSRAVLGFILGLLYHRTKNIWVNVIAHFLNNLLALIQLFYMSGPGKQPDLSNPKVPWWFALLALAILVLLFRMLMKYSAANKEKIDAQEQLVTAKENVYNPFAKTEIN